ncbi:hypothetical protein GGI04_004909, partial [Coemansia thaxteri]
MAKRSGDISVEFESSERKRLRNASPAPLAWMAPHLSEDRQCSNMITDLLRESQSGPLPRIMDVAVQLVQGLKRLQLLDTPFARQSFEQHYSDVLSYVGNVMDRIKL